MTFSQCEHVGEKKKTPRTFGPDAGADDGTADAPTGGDTAGCEAPVEPVLPGEATAGEAAAGAAWDAPDAGDAGDSERGGRRGRIGSLRGHRRRADSQEHGEDDQGKGAKTHQRGRVGAAALRR